MLDDLLELYSGELLMCCMRSVNVFMYMFALAACCVLYCVGGLFF